MKYWILCPGFHILKTQLLSPTSQKHWEVLNVFYVMTCHPHVLLEHQDEWWEWNVSVCIWRIWRLRMKISAYAWGPIFLATCSYGAFWDSKLLSTISSMIKPAHSLCWRLKSQRGDGGKNIIRSREESRVLGSTSPAMGKFIVSSNLWEKEAAHH